MFLSKHRLNIAPLRIGKHRIAKKSEHRPPLPACCSPWENKWKLMNFETESFPNNLLDVRSRARQHISQIFVSLWWTEIILKAWWIKEQPIKLSPYQRSPFSRVALVLLHKKNQPSEGEVLPHLEVNHRPGRLDKPKAPMRREMASQGWKRKDRKHFQTKVCPKIQL